MRSACHSCPVAAEGRLGCPLQHRNRAHQCPPLATAVPPMGDTGTPTGTYCCCGCTTEFFTGGSASSLFPLATFACGSQPPDIEQQPPPPPFLPVACTGHPQVTRMHYTFAYSPHLTSVACRQRNKPGPSLDQHPTATSDEQHNTHGRKAHTPFYTAIRSRRSAIIAPCSLSLKTCRDYAGFVRSMTLVWGL